MSSRPRPLQHYTTQTHHHATHRVIRTRWVVSPTPIAVSGAQGSRRQCRTRFAGRIHAHARAPDYQTTTSNKRAVSPPRQRAASRITCRSNLETRRHHLIIHSARRTGLNLGASKHQRSEKVTGSCGFRRVERGHRGRVSDFTLRFGLFVMVGAISLAFTSRGRCLHAGRCKGRLDRGLCVPHTLAHPALRSHAPSLEPM